MSTVIDVHTHMLNDLWLSTILEHGGHYSLKELGGQRVIHYGGAPFMTLMDPMFDYAQRIKDILHEAVRSLDPSFGRSGNLDEMWAYYGEMALFDAQLGFVESQQEILYNFYLHIVFHWMGYFDRRNPSD